MEKIPENPLDLEEIFEKWFNFANNEKLATSIFQELQEQAKNGKPEHIVTPSQKDLARFIDMVSDFTIGLIGHQHKKWDELAVAMIALSASYWAHILHHIEEKGQKLEDFDKTDLLVSFLTLVDDFNVTVADLAIEKFTSNKERQSRINNAMRVLKEYEGEK